MPIWRHNPTLYEINTWVWLSDLSRKHGTAVNLNSVPAAEWEAIAKFGFDAVWLMGVWERSPAGIEIANRNENLLADFRRALPDFRAQDNVGSPYCIRRYVVDDHLGGSAGLASARKELDKCGMKLALILSPTMLRRTIHGSSSTPSTSFEAALTMPRTIRHRSSRCREMFLLADEIPIFRHGRMCCS